MVNIYKLLDPITNEIRYIGKTKEALNKRLGKHIFNRTGNSKVQKWCRKLHKENKRPIIELIEKCSFDKWEEREKYWIAFYRNRSDKILNILDGGDNHSTGFKHTEEAKRRISILNSRPKSKEWIKNSTEAMRKAVAKPIIQYALDGTFIKKWDSFCYASKKLKLSKNYKSAIKNIHACCNHKRKTAYGFKWEYENIESLDKELVS
jgi:hypothetical protein